jgi:DNA-binding NarL/FixJ family response regulator
VTTTCLIADDHPALLVAVADYLGENGFDVVAAVATGPAAVVAAAESRPTLALLDYRMPGSTGEQLVRDVKHASP